MLWTKQQQFQEAMNYFWKVVTTGATSDQDDNADSPSSTGSRSAKQMDKLAELTESIARECGVPGERIYWKSRTALPGVFRGQKRWDLLVVDRDSVVAAIEFKSLSPDFNQNLNNRIEESIGSAFDFRAAERRNLFGDNATPWLGFFFILMDHPDLERIGRNYVNPHFAISERFGKASTKTRANIWLRELMAEKLYHQTAMVLSTPSIPTIIREPDVALSAQKFFDSFASHLRAHINSR